LEDVAPSGLKISLHGSSYVAKETPSSTAIFYDIILDSVLVDTAIAWRSDRYVTAGNVIVGTTASAPVPVATQGPLPLCRAAAAFSWSRRLRRRLVAGRPRLLNAIGRPWRRLFWR